MQKNITILLYARGSDDGSLRNFVVIMIEMHFLSFFQKLLHHHLFTLVFLFKFHIVWESDVESNFWFGI